MRLVCRRSTSRRKPPPGNVPKVPPNGPRGARQSLRTVLANRAEFASMTSSLKLAVLLAAALSSSVAIFSPVANAARSWGRGHRIQRSTLGNLKAFQRDAEPSTTNHRATCPQAESGCPKPRRSADSAVVGSLTGLGLAASGWATSPKTCAGSSHTAAAYMTAAPPLFPPLQRTFPSSQCCLHPSLVPPIGSRSRKSTTF